MKILIKSIVDFNLALPRIRTQRNDIDFNWAINYRKSLLLIFKFGFTVQYEDGYFYHVKYWPLMDD